MDDEKYLFVCYSNEDYEKVDNVFLGLYKRGIPIKEAKDDRSEYVENLISECEAVLFVISSASLSSRTLMYYMELADQYNKHVIPYVLYPSSEVRVPSDLLMRMDGSAAIPAYMYDETEESALLNRAERELRPYFPIERSRSKKRKSPVVPVLCTAAICALAVAVYFFFIKPANQEKLMEKLRNSSVIIYEYVKGESEEDDTFYSGSGFFINSDGLLATNYHVISDYSYILVQPSNEPEEYYDAKVVAYDKYNDLALLKIEDSYEVKDYLSFSTSDVKTGDEIYVVGYPRGIDLTISNGIVSNNKHMSDGIEYLLITAAVSPGNSGGAVVDHSGKVVGVATAKYKSAENLNLARPVSYLKQLVDAVN